jgi:hypothetical protein
LKWYIEQYGRPLALYSDKHSIRPRWIASCAALPAKSLQLMERLLPMQIMDRLQHWLSMRLYRDFVLWTQCIEIQRSHNRGHRRTAGLMIPNL